MSKRGEKTVQALYNTSTDSVIGDYPGDVPEALDAYAQDRGWSTWAQWCAEGRAPVGELALVDRAGEAVYL